MKNFLNGIGKGLGFGIGIILIIASGISYATYNTISDITPNSKLTSSIFNQILGNVRDINDRIDKVSNGPIFKANLGYTGGSSYPNNQSYFKLPSVINFGGGYDQTTGTFTAPIAGYYSFAYTSAGIANGTSLGDIMFTLNGIANENTISPASVFDATSGRHTRSSDTILYLNIGDKVAIYRSCCSSNGKPSYWRATFMGNYIHP